MQYKRFPLGGLWTNGYLFVDTQRRAFFVDPGGQAEEVFDYLKKNDLSLEAVLLTHGHLDHLAGIEDFVALVGDRIYIASNDASLLKHPPEEMQRYLQMSCRGIEHFQIVSDGEIISVGDFNIKAIVTPGHTEGSMCYLVRMGGEEVLLTGDTLFAQSVGRTDLPGGDASALERSLLKLAELSDDLVVLPGHGPDTTIRRERTSNPFWPR